jgi:hypothetical protein
MKTRTIAASLASLVIMGVSACAPAENTAVYPAGSVSAPIRDDPARAGPGGTINPTTGTTGAAGSK